MQIIEEEQNNIYIYKISGRLDSNTSPEFEAKITQVIEAGSTRLIIDFEKLDYLSSAGLRVLLKATKMLKTTDGRMVLCSLADYVREVFEISGFDTFLPIVATFDDAEWLSLEDEMSFRFLDTGSQMVFVRFGDDRGNLSPTTTAGCLVDIHWDAATSSEGGNPQGRAAHDRANRQGQPTGATIGCRTVHRCADPHDTCENAEPKPPSPPSPGTAEGGSFSATRAPRWMRP